MAHKERGENKKKKKERERNQGIEKGGEKGAR